MLILKYWLLREISKKMRHVNENEYPGLKMRILRVMNFDGFDDDGNEPIFPRES